VKIRSWKPEVIADSSGKWCPNGLAFAKKEDAEAWVSDLSCRWTASARHPGGAERRRAEPMTTSEQARADALRVGHRRFRLAQWYGSRFGYSGRSGGWIYSERTGRTVCQGWLAFYHQFREQIWREVLRDEQ